MADCVLFVSAAHTKADIDTTLEALIAVEKEVDEQLNQTIDVVKTPECSWSEIENWANGFVDHLNSHLADTSIPQLKMILRFEHLKRSLTIQVADNQVLVQQDDVASDTESVCSIQLMEQQGLQGLLQFDLQLLLRNICYGDCVLSGQVEPFIWFVARMFDRQQLQDRSV